MKAGLTRKALQTRGQDVGRTYWRIGGERWGKEKGDGNANERRRVWKQGKDLQEM